MTERTSAAAGEIVITRVFDAPRELVWRAWIEPERFVRWWGPNGFTTPACEIDPRPGGVLHFCMRSPDGQDLWGGGVFREVVEPERLVYTDYFADERGNKVPPAHYGLADWPEEALVTVTFEEQAGKTTLTLRHSVGPVPAADLAGAEQGWTESLARLAAYLATP